jgi:uncharacterized membrane protein
MTGWTLGFEAWLVVAAWAVVMIVAVWLLVREPHHESQDDPGAILRARFARGEIGEQEYLRATAALAADPPNPSLTGTRHDSAHHTLQDQEARDD